MDFGYTPQQEALRQEVRAFIAENMTPAVMEEVERLAEPETSSLQVAVAGGAK